jgi:hypothetical protein
MLVFVAKLKWLVPVHVTRIYSDHEDKSAQTFWLHVAQPRIYVAQHKIVQATEGTQILTVKLLPAASLPCCAVACASGLCKPSGSLLLLCGDLALIA